MGNFEKLSVLVIVVIIVMILVVALYTWTGDPSGGDPAAASVAATTQNDPARVEFAPRAKEKDVGLAAKDLTVDASGKRLDAAPPDAAKLLEEMLRDRRVKSGLAEAGTNGARAGESDAVADESKPVAAKEPRVHVVAPGETIGKIAKLEFPGVGQRAIDAILKANPTVDPSRMAIGYRLVLPELVATDPRVAIESPRNVPAPIATPAATIKPGSIYVTKKGDTLPGLAKRAYRDSNQWHRIWVENFDEIQDTERLAAGMRLRIPIL